MVKKSRKTNSTIERALKRLEEEEQLMNNHIVTSCALDINTILEHITHKIRFLKNYAENLKPLIRGKNQKQIEQQILEIRSLEARLKSDRVGKLKYPDSPQLNPVAYLKYYLTNMSSYLLDVISKLIKIEFELKDIQDNS